MRQDTFLSSETNKSRLLSIKKEKLKAANISAKQAEDDADACLYHKTALEHSQTYSKTIVAGEDVDLLILLIARNVTYQEIYFSKPGKGKVETIVYSSKSLDNSNYSKNPILLVHATNDVILHLHSIRCEKRKL